jgi:hypothetical protein
MIITIRNQFKHSSFRYVAGFIVIILGFGVVSVPTLMRNQQEAWAIKINGEKVLYQAFAREIAEQSEFLAHIRAQYGQYADYLLQAMNWPTDPRALAFDVLVKSALMNQLVSSLGIAIHPDYITESINNAQFARRHLQKVLPAFVFDQAGTLNGETLHMFLQHQGISIREFERNIERTLAQLQAMQLVASSSYLPLFDIEQTFIAHKLGKKFSYIMFSLDAFLAAEKKNTISDEDAVAFYTKENTTHRRYWVPEKRDGALWKFDAKHYNLSISDQQINSYYEDNKVSKYVLDPVKVQVQQITEQQMPAGMSLEMVKADLENNPSSSWAAKWESIAPFARSEKKGALENAAFLLQNSGDISSVIETDNGKVIIQLVKRIARTYKPLAAVKNEIKTVLMEKQFKKSFAKDFKELISKGDMHELELFIAQKGGKKEIVTGIAKDDTQLSQELFALKKGEYAFFMHDDVGYAVTLSHIAERNLPEFDSIKQIVKDDLCYERAHTAMMNGMKEARKTAQTDSLETIAHKHHASLHHIDMIKPDDAKRLQELDKKGLPARTMVGLEKAGTIVEHHTEKASFLIKVDEIEAYSPADLAAAQKEIATPLAQQRTRGYMESIVASLHRNATIETNESILIADEKYSE